VKVASGTRGWLAGVAAYTVAGLLTSTLMGAALGTTGRWLVGDELRTVAVTVVLAFSIVAALRGFGWSALVLPRVRRQTREWWGKQFPIPVAATLWGLDLGLAIFTPFTFAGLSILVGLVIAMGDPVFGALVFASFWVARALPVWLAPRLAQTGDTVLDVVRAVDGQRSLFRRINTSGVVFSAGVLTAILASAAS
jgi:hypothetical protein